MLKLSVDSKDYGVKNHTFYVLDLVCFSLTIEALYFYRKISAWKKLLDFSQVTKILRTKFSVVVFFL